MGITFRDAITSDRDAIQKLNIEMFEHDAQNDDDLDMGWPFSKAGQDFYNELASGDTRKCILAEVDGTTVGFVAVKEKKFGYRKSKYMEVEVIGVTPKFRSQGIGGMLMDKSIEYSKELGADRLFVDVFGKNNEAIKFYKQHGFEGITVQLEKKLR